MQPGQSLGKYQIVEPLGSGGMGEVYLAEDGLLQRKVALKIINPALAQNSRFVERFRREAQALAAVYHPNVVHVHSLDEIDGELVIDMEYVEGGSLADRMPVSPLPVEMVLPVLRDVLSALAWCHGAGYVHRDIKPGNVLIDVAGRARVADFGLAAAYAEALDEAMAERTSTGLLWGTPRYAPPEAWDGAAPAPGWDVFAVGVLAYELLTAQAPFPSDAPLKMLREMSAGPAASVRALAPDVPEWLDALVMQMLAADPAVRQQDAGEALEVIERSGAPLPPRSQVLPLTRRMSPDSRRARFTPAPRGRRIRRLSLQGIALAIVIASGFAVWMLNAGVKPNVAEQSPLLQEAVFAYEMPDAAALITLWKGNPERRTVYDVIDVESGDRREGALLIEEIEEGQQGLLVRERGFWQFDIAPPAADGAAALSGRWALYTSATADMLDTGSLSGTARAEPQAGLLLQLEFSSEVDGSSWRRSFLGRPSVATDAVFIQQIEQAPLLQPLLLLDLIPGAAPWAGDIAALLPPYIHGRIHAVPSEAAASIDGVLDESCWTSAEALPGRPFAANASLNASVSADGVALGFETPGVFEAAQLEIVVQPGLVFPASASPQYRFTLNEEGVTAVQERSAGEWRASEVSVQGVLRRTEQGVTAEVFIEGEARLAPWRCNARLSTTASGETGIVAEWGWPDLEDTLHGVVLVFDAP